MLMNCSAMLLEHRFLECCLSVISGTLWLTFSDPAEGVVSVLTELNMGLVLTQIRI